MKTTTYQDRVKAHDILALPAVDYLFKLMGYNHFELGIEREKQKFRNIFLFQKTILPVVQMEVCHQIDVQGYILLEMLRIDFFPHILI